MSGNFSPARLVLLFLGMVTSGGTRGAEPGVVQVEAGELTRRSDLLGCVVSVDDRVARFQWHGDSETATPDRPYDEIYLKRTSVVFRLPPRLRFETAPRALAIRLEGVLKREGALWVCDVTGLELFPSDLERLERATAVLDPRDTERREAWARWAERRARAFSKPNDASEAALLERAHRLEAEAIQIEAEKRVADPPAHWLVLARRARQREVPEPEPGALAHRAFAARLAAAARVEDLAALVKDIEDFWPASTAPLPSPVALDAWLTPYANDAATTYRTAPDPVRAALDHRIWSEAALRLVERRMAAEPAHTLELALDAATALRDRPQEVRRLLEQGLKEASRDLGTLRQGDVLELARVYRERLEQPEAARELLRHWLDDQRNHRLSATDAEGRVLLAQQYDTLLGARDTAVALLRDAWHIDPQSREVADAFRRFDFRRINDEWVEAPRAVDSPTEAATQAAGRAATSTALRGLTPQEVRARLGGKPDRVNYSASQGELIEQWIYREATQDRYVNFLHTPGEAVPKVVACYARSRSRYDATRPR